jgi:gamma-glutamyltranspeptidase/glutathione hydrolase
LKQASQTLPAKVRLGRVGFSRVSPSSHRILLLMADFGYDFPYPSQRMPVLAGNIVATSQPLAAQAGLQMLEQGGNAVDAAIAAAATLTVVEPTSNGIGSDAFALLFTQGKLYGLNASGRSPAALSLPRFAGHQTVHPLGWDAVTVPGAVSAWVALSDRFGRLPLQTLLEPAIGYASNGYLVTPQTAESWSALPDRYPGFEALHSTFCPGGRPPEPGERIVLADHGRTLKQIADSKGAAFYQGVLARQIVEASTAAGGLMTEQDLAAHEAEWVEPIWVRYRDYVLHELPPNGQGLVALLMLGILEHFPIAETMVDSADSLHLQIEAMKLAFVDGHRYIADPAWMDVDVAHLLDPKYLAERARLIDPNRAQDFEHGTPQPGGTVYLAAADAQGMMVSYIQSNYMGFGSGVVVPGTGISMQNRGAGFTLKPGHPNAAEGGKRPFHTIIPGFVTRADEQGNHQPVMSFGVMGGPMQTQGHAQVMVRLADYHQNPQAALDAPRWQVFQGRHVGIESGLAPEVYEQLEQRGHAVEIVHDKTVRYGGGQAIYKLDEGYLGASDLRRDGQAVGY